MSVRANHVRSNQGTVACVDLRDSMAAYDAMPADMRQLVREAPARVNCVELVEAARTRGWDWVRVRATKGIAALRDEWRQHPCGLPD